MNGVLSSWGKILRGYKPCLSIEITRECPLTCPGCYAYNPEHLGGSILLRELIDLRGKDLVDGILETVKIHKPLHVSIIGGEPLVRFRELNEVLPQLASKGVLTQVVTSAVRPIPMEWMIIPHLQVSVSIDGLQPDHDVRRKPATYERILKHIEGRRITIHCTITRQQLRHSRYFEEFLGFWSPNPAVQKIWFSLYTPQVGEDSEEKLTPDDRKRVVRELSELRTKFPKIDMPLPMLRAYLNPPKSPGECVFSKVTTCLSADLKKQITPCQFGGNPDCSNCGCAASAGLTAIGRYRLLSTLSLDSIFDASLRIGKTVKRLVAKPQQND